MLDESKIIKALTLIKLSHEPPPTGAIANANFAGKTTSAKRSVC